MNEKVNKTKGVRKKLKLSFAEDLLWHFAESSVVPPSGILDLCWRAMNSILIIRIDWRMPQKQKC